MKNTASRSLWSTQRGFTLVELMVSMAIGLVIVLFVTTMYVSSRSSYRLNDDNMRIQQDGRAVMHLIGRNLMQAGFGNLVTLNSVAPTDFSAQGLFGCATGFDNPATFVAGTKAACALAAAGKPAGFEVSYRVDNTVNANIEAGTDCNGQAASLDASGNRVAVNRFYLADNAGSSTLFCSGNGSGPQPLLGNVEVMLLTYGIDTDGDSSPDRFVNSATDVNGLTADWKGVVSVGVCLEISSANDVTPGLQSYAGCNGQLKQAPDRRMRTVLNSTFTLRNNAAASTL